MVAAVETMAYANEVPWHGLGNKVSNKLSAEEMQKAASLHWNIYKGQIFFKTPDGKMLEFPDRFAIARDFDNRPYDIVSHTWKMFQNADGFDFFKKFITAGHMEMETAGSLWDGKYIWVLARVKHDFRLGKNDDVRSYLLMCIPHQHGKAVIIQFTAIRVVCWNTLSWALGANLKGDKTAFRVPHSVTWSDAMKAKAEEALGIATQQMDEFKEVTQLLTKAKAPKEVVEDYFCEVLKFDPKEKGAREPLILPKFRVALTHSPGAQMATANGTMWGALNAVSYVIDHDGKDRQTALKNAWFGHKAGVKRRAVDLAVDYAKKAKKAA